MVVRPRAVLIGAGLVVLALILACIDLATGEFTLPLRTIVDVFGGDGTKPQRFIVLDVRLPRVLLGALVGAALGIAGALTQSTLRNPLAAPDILGITSGASVTAIAVIVFAGAGTVGVPAAALVGGVVTAATIYALSWRTGLDGFRLVLIGIGVNAMLVAAVNWLLIYAKIEDVARAQVWLNGSLNGADWTQFWTLATGFVIAVGLAAWSAPTLWVLRFGDDKARSLGVRLQLRQGVILFAAVALASLATAATGPVGFVALTAPQIARRLLRTPVEPIVGSALVGAVLVLAGDIVTKSLLPVPLPVGIATSALGGIFLLYLLVSTNRKATV